MIVDERFVTYINSLEQENPPLLSKIEAEALSARVPVIRRETQGLLKFLLAMSRPRRILEVGTAVGVWARLLVY